MKKILTFFVLIAVFASYSKTNAQCSVSDPGFTIRATKDTLVNSQQQCVVTFDLNFKLEYNGGNKIVVIQAWLDADYPNYWNCSSTHTQTGNHGSPTGTDLKKNGTGPLPFIDLAFNNDVEPPLPITTYGPDNSVQLFTNYTITRGAVDANGFQSFTLTGVKTLVPAPCGTGVTIRADLWSSQGSLSSQWQPHCVNCNNLYSFNYPRVTAQLDCLNPRHYQVRIENINTNQTIVISGWKAYLDNTTVGQFDPPSDVLADDQSSNTHTLAPNDVYTSPWMTYTGNSTAPDINKNVWVAVSTVGLPNTQNAIATNACFPLPVRLTYFNAKRNNATAVSLTWQTAEELNSSGFEIQRQVGNGAWQVVGFVATQAPDGNSSSLLNYSFTDFNNAKAITQYRLKEIDIDAHSKFSEIRAVRGEGQAGKIIVYPNPSFDGTAKVVFEDINGTRDVSLIDITGRMVRQWSGVTNNNLEITNLTPGYYNLRVVIRETGEQSTEKIVVNKR